METDMTKEEFYKKLIDNHKEHGQGLSGIVKASSEQLGQYLDEFIAEGLIIACDTGGSLGHPESNVFYMPTKGYNVWLDGEDSDGYSGRYLSHVRLYLGVQEEDSEWEISTRQLLQSPELLSEYLVWLERNDAALKEMLALDDFYQAPHTKFSKDELEFWKSREWYEKNKSVAEIKKANKERLELNEQLVKKTNEILKLMSSEPTKYSKEIEKYEQDIIDTGRENVRRKKLNSFLNNHSNSDKIQSILN